MPLSTWIFVVAFVDRRVKRFDHYQNGGIRRAVMALPARHILRDAIERRQSA
jgi:hypothetical protein